MQFVVLDRARQLALREREIMCSTLKSCSDEGAPYQQPPGRTTTIEKVLVLDLVVMAMVMAMVQRLVFEAYFQFETRLNSDIALHELGNCDIVACPHYTI